LPGLQVGGVTVGERGELLTGTAGERGQLVRDLDLAVLAGGADGDRHGAGLFAGSHPGVGDARARLPAGDEPDGVLAVGAGLEDGARLGVVHGRGREAGVPAGCPVLLAARGEQAEGFRGWQRDLDVTGEPALRSAHGCSSSLCASAAVRVRP
jgi:hypothetical protein